MRAPDLRTIYAAVAITLGTFLLGFTFWHSANTDPMWAVAAFILVYDPDPRAAYGAGVSRMLYTLLGCVLSIGAIFLFGLHKWLLPVGLGVTVLICGYVFGFRGGWRALMVCVALVIGSSLIDPSGDVHIALTRGIEVAAGSALAILFSLPFAWFEKRKGSSSPKVAKD
jgi:uncharacterized membrane protein YccC